MTGVAQWQEQTTLECSCRFLYSLNGPPSPEVLTAVRAVLQALSLVLVALVSSGNVVGDKSQRPDKDTAKVEPTAWLFNCPSRLLVMQSVLSKGGKCPSAQQTVCEMAWLIYSSSYWRAPSWGDTLVLEREEPLELIAPLGLKCLVCADVRVVRIGGWLGQEVKQWAANMVVT